MPITKSITLLSLLLFALSCRPSTQVEQEKMSESTTSQTSAPAPGVMPTGPIIDQSGQLELGMLAEFPKEVEGCSCALRMDGTGTKEYLLVYGYEGPAILILNDKRLSLYYDLERPGHVGKEIFQHLFVNERFMVETDLTNEGQASDEVWNYSGTIRITDQQSQAYKIIRVVGECGC